jgi:hypothetical protein
MAPTVTPVPAACLPRRTERKLPGEAPSPAVKVTIWRRYGVPLGVRVVSMFAMLFAITSIRRRSAVSAEELVRMLLKNPMVAS